MSMIHSTALENGRVAQRHDMGDVVPHAARPWWRVHPLIPCAVIGLVLAAAGGHALLAPDASRPPPPVVTADADKPPAERSPVADEAATPREPAGGRVPAGDADGPERTGAEAKPTAEAAIGAERPAAAKPDERPADADGKAIASPGSGQPPPADTPPPVDTPSPIVTGSIERTDAPPAARLARIVSDVNMRAGPSNSQPVLASISRGKSVEVISCRTWCEVVFAGQRGWVYRGFVAMP
jgi:hypothetical protein